MNHSDRTLELLSCYIDGRLSREEREELERHLAACERCREELQSLRWTVGLLHALPMVRVPRSFAIPRPSARGTGVALFWLRTATALAAALLLIVISADLLQSLGGLGMSGVPSPPRELLSQRATTPQQEVALARPAPTPALASPAATAMPRAAAPLAAGAAAPSPAPDEEAAQLRKGADSVKKEAVPTAAPSPGSDAQPSLPLFQQLESGPRPEVSAAEGRTPISWQLSAVRTLEAILLILALTLAVATLWAGRREGGR